MTICRVAVRNSPQGICTVATFKILDLYKRLPRMPYIIPKEYDISTNVYKDSNTCELQHCKIECNTSKTNLSSVDQQIWRIWLSSN